MTNTEPVENSDATVKNSKQVPKKSKNSQTKQDVAAPSQAIDQLTEKQRRKLEWEQKFAQQKQSETKSDLSKAELKAKRREQQEAQRMAKTSKPTELNPVEKSQVTDTVKKVVKSPPKKVIKLKAVEYNEKPLQLVKHLSKSTNPEYKVVNFKDIPPAFIRLGVQYAEKTILGSNARNLALLSAIKCVVNDIFPPPKQEFCRYLQKVLEKSTNYLQDCRPFAVSMTNSLRAVNLQLRSIETSLTDEEKRIKLLEVIGDYIRNDVFKAWDAICLKVNEKIVDGDVILTYGCSSLIYEILRKAKTDGKKFSVIIVDSRPLLEGREMLRRLVSEDIKCLYALINGLSSIMKKATKVLLGTHGLLTNGSVMSRIGTSHVALLAQAFNKPVLVCCETYKFSERVQTDSFVYNEIGNSETLLHIDTANFRSILTTQKDNTKMNALNLLYDVTPPDLITAVVTELAILPCTSVPVVLRINAGDAPV